MAKFGGLAAGLSLAALALCMAAPASAQDEKVGVTAAVNPDATGTPPQRAMRTLSVGLDMIRNERIVTGPEGKTQLLFVDGSALTIGPNAELMLDEFVYDPNTGTGKLAMTATKGVFRVVGGKISKTDAITLKTPTATLGIRGGIATAEVGANGFFGFLFGQKMTVDGTGADGQPTQQVVTRPGTGVPLGANGTVGSPIPIPPEKMQAAMQALEGDTGKNGGARERPTDNRVANAGLGSLGSDLPPDVVGAEPAAGGPGAPGTGLPPVPDTSIISQLILQNTAVSPSSSGTSTPTTPTTVAGTFGGRYKSTPGSGSSAGTAGDGSLTFDRPFTDGSLSDNTFTVTVLGNTFSAPVNPSGGFLNYEGATSPFGPITGTSFISANRDFLFFESFETSFPDERSFLFAGIATPLAAIPTDGFAAYDIRRDFVGGTNIPFIPAALGGNLSGTVSPAFIGLGGQRPFLQASIAINGAGDTQSSAVSILLGQLGASGALLLTGEMRGSSRLGGDFANFFYGPVGFALDGSGNGVFGASSPDYFVLESRGSSLRGITTSDGDFNFGTYYPNNVASRNPGFAVGSRTSGTTMQGFINGVTTTDFGSSRTLNQISGFSAPGTFVLATVPELNTVFAGASLFGGGAYTLFWGDGMSVGGRSAFIDDRRFAAIESDVPSTSDQDGPSIDMVNPRLYLVSGGLADISGLLPSGVTACECSFMRWGFWGGDFTNSITGQRERIHLGQWVAGDLAGAAEIAALTGSANYAGHAVADIINGGRVYKAGGGFSMSYNFGTRTGGVGISNLDGVSYTGSVSAFSGVENAPSGSIGGTHNTFGGVGGPINLGFYRNGANPAAGVGGAFNASSSGNAYQATGIVVGQQVGPGS